MIDNRKVVSSMEVVFVYMRLFLDREEQNRNKTLLWMEMSPQSHRQFPFQVYLKKV
jgi:hypothetical protein